MTFVEATVRIPTDDGELHHDKRLINLDDVQLITRAGPGTQDASIFHMRPDSDSSLLSALVVDEPYAYWVAILTASQSRPA